MVNMNNEFKTLTKLTELRSRINDLSEDITICENDIRGFHDLFPHYEITINEVDDSSHVHRVPSAAVKQVLLDEKNLLEDWFENNKREFAAQVIKLYIQTNPTLEDFEYGIERGLFTKSQLPDAMKPNSEAGNHSAIMAIDDDDDELDD